MDLIDVRCPQCGKKLIVLSASDKDVDYVQSKCQRCKIEVFYSHGKIHIK